MGKFKPTEEQKQILSNDKKTLIVSASAGSGKTAVLVEYITRLVSGVKKVPIKRLLVLTFTNVAAGEMKERLLTSLCEKRPTNFLLDQIDNLPTADICTIDSFCERVIKKNLDKLTLDQNFTILDEGQALRIKKEAFENACQNMTNTFSQDFWHIYNAFSRNKDLIFECMTHIENFMDCTANPNQIVDKIFNEQEDLFNISCDIVMQDIQEQFCQFENTINEVLKQDIHPAFSAFATKMLEFVKNCKQLDLKNLTAVDFALPSTPASNYGKQIASILSTTRASIKKLFDDIKKFKWDEPYLSIQKNGTLAKTLLKLYLDYKNCYKNIKEREDYLDFADIESIAAQLLENQDVAEELQKAYDYVFIDEYQDTNTLQERIVKKVAQLGNFVAVGDPKQSIYGFRNASMEIMKRDLNQNQNAQDGKVVYLRGNFRSDGRILNFVNKIFAPIMDFENSGIDYFNTSMLEQKAPYKYDDKKAVQVYFVNKNEQESDDKNQVYSVKNAPLIEKDTARIEAQTIVKSIDDALTSKIYDVKKKQWRKAELNDIVVLLRGTGSVMTSLENELTAQGYPFVTNNKQSMLKNCEVQVLINFLKLCLSQNSETALASVLLSYLGKMTTDEISNIICRVSGQTLTEKLLNAGNEKVNNVFNLINQFKQDVEIYGIRGAFELLFDKTDYFIYLKHLGKETEGIIERFLNLTKSSDCEFKIASFLSYLNSLGDETIAASESTNAIRIMTIHGSKGQEYPIVILGGCGNQIISPNRKPYLMTEKLGLSIMGFDEKSLLKFKTIQFEAAKILKKRSEYLDELMIFYVALTRAKNRLILTGQYDLQDWVHIDNLFQAKCYFDWLLAGQNPGLVQNILSQDKFENEDAVFYKVDEVEDIKKVEKQNLIYEEDENLTKKIEKYLNFSYKNIDLSKISFKNSVTGLLKLEIDDKPQDYEEHDSVAQNGFTASQVGTIYHTALKEIDFAEINTLQDLEKKLDELVEKNYLSNDERAVLDKNILYKDIILLRNLTKNKKIYKEKPFIMKIKLNEVIESKFEDKVLVQGIVDMFALGDENILVDYKFTSIKNSEKLIEKYKKQIILYSKAIENAFNIKLNKKYLFSIKNCNLIEIC